MANNLSFSIAVNMLTEGVKSGAAKVVQNLKAMQMQILTFVAAISGAGIGLSSLVSKLMEVARETNRVTTALKNVSDGMRGYAETQKFLLELSDKYGVYINDLTGNFAKFTAAANNAGVSMNDQKKIFTALSRAAVGFGLSADDTNLSMLAVTQMMSKGKISSEELRRQLGEKIPIAMAAMAKGAGVPIQKLDKLLQQGKLMSAEVLPKFADALNEMLPNVNTDNLETSINRLKNAFVEFTNGTGTQQAFKSVVNGITKLVQILGQNINAVISSISAFVIGVLEGKLWIAVSKYFTGISTKIKSYATQAEVAEAQVLSATSKRVKAQEILDLSNLAFSKSTGVEKVKAKKAVNAAQIALDKALATEERALIAQTEAQSKVAQFSSMTRWGRFTTTIATAFKTLATTIKAAFASFLPTLVFVGISELISYIVTATKKANELKRAMSDYKTNVSNAGENDTTVKDLKYNYSIATSINKGLRERKEALNAINLVLGTGYSINEKTLKIEGDINAKYHERLLEAKKLSEFNAIQNSKRETEQKIKDAASGTGLSVAKLQDIVDIYIKSGANKSSKIPNEFNAAVSAGVNSTGLDASSPIAWSRAFYNIIDAVKSIAIQNAVYNQATRDENKYMSQGIGLQETKKIDPYVPAPDTKQTPLQKQENKYAKALSELETKRIAEKMTVSDYNEAYDKITVNALAEAQASKDKTILNSKYLQNLKELSKTPKTNADDILNDAKTTYTEKVNVQKNLLDKGAISQQNYDDSIINLSDDVAKSALSIKDIGTKADEFVKSLRDTIANSELSKVQTEYSDTLKEKQNLLDQKLITPDQYNKEVFDAAIKAITDASSIKNIGNKADTFLSQTKTTALNSIPELKFKPQRDTTFDYEKTNLDILQEKYDELNRHIEKLKSLSDKALGDELVNQLKNDQAAAEDFKKALTYQRALEDIKEYKRELGLLGGDFRNFENIVGGIESIYSAWENVKDSFSDKSAFEGVLSVLNAIISTVDAIDSTVSAIKDVAEVVKKLTAAKQLEQSIDDATTAKKVANVATGVAAEVAGAAVTKATAAGEVAANTAVAGSGAAASVASIPFVGPVLALAALASIVAAIASISKFATGGIVGGNSPHGDKILARLNSGEMVLNGGQQSTLYGLLNSQTSGSTKTDIKVRGSDLYLTLHNYQRQTGKKL